MEGYQLDWAALNVAIGAVLPLVISLVKRPGWSDSLKRVVATLVSLIAAVVATWVQVGGLTDLNVLLMNVGLIVTMTQSTYAMFWKDTPPEAALSAV